MNLATMLQADVIGPLLNAMTPGTAVLVVFVALLTSGVMTLRGMRRELDGIKGSMVTKDSLEASIKIVLLQLREELDQRYDGRFLRSDTGYTHSRVGDARSSA